MKRLVVITLILSIVSSHDQGPTRSSEEENSESNHLILELNEKENYVFTLNETSSKVALLNPSNNVSAIYDGLSGSAFVYAYEEGRGVYIPPGVSNLIWDVKRQTYEEYFQNPIPPKQLLQVGEQYGLQIDPQLITESLSEKMTEILMPLSSDYSSQCEALSNALVASKRSSDRLRTTLSGYFQVMGTVKLRSRGDCNWQVGLYNGFATFFEPFGGLKALSDKHIRLDLQQIAFKEKTPFHVLIYFLETLNPHFQLGQILQKLLNCETSFFELVCGLGGEITYGFDGFLCVISEIEKYIAKDNSIDNLKHFLKKYFTNPKVDDDDLSQKWRTSVQDLAETIKQLKLDESFSGLMKLFKNILDDKWKNGDVCMSEVVQTILDVELPGNEDSVNNVIEKIKDNSTECCKDGEKVNNKSK